MVQTSFDYENQPFDLNVPEPPAGWSPNARANPEISSASELRYTLFELVASVSATSLAYWISLSSMKPAMYGPRQRLYA